MANFSEISSSKQWGMALGSAILITVALYFTYFKSQRQANDTAQQALNAKQQENAELAPYRTKLADIDRQIANLQQQLEIEQRIVPDEKEVDDFMKMLDAEATKAGVYIRRYTALATSNKEFYTEVPFDMELDGPYYGLLTFFDQVSKLERIVTVSNLLIANPKHSGDAKTKHTYQYAPNESVVATCTATTFFTHSSASPSGPAATVPAAAPASAATRVQGRSL
jgi:type IV pilus assembly protein PilO